MSKQAFNPYLPSWEYIPDGEPHVFEDRVYVYGSHDRFNGHAYCLNDYICYSAPVDDLTDWRYEGVIYRKIDDPINEDGEMCLYAPDVTQGPDGRYYLYYVLDHVSIVSVAVCDTPAGKYEFLGYVHYADGTRLGDREGDQPQFDPGVLTEGDKTYLYTGFSGPGDKSRFGAMGCVLAADMLTIIEDPVVVVPGPCYSEGSGFEGYEYFEAASIRKCNDTYYFVYSGYSMHELCYATSKDPMKGFTFGGVLVSNCDWNIDTYKPADMKTNYAGNNHGGMECINGQWYIFYHRHTNGTCFCRQTVAEPITIAEDGSIAQVELTSCGLNGGPLVGKGEYPAYIVCNIFSKSDVCNDPLHSSGWISGHFARIMQDGRDGDEELGYVANIRENSIVGFKYFDFNNVTRIGVKTRGYGNGVLEVKLTWDGETIVEIPVGYTNLFQWTYVDAKIPDGIHALYFEFKGEGGTTLGAFDLVVAE